MASSPQSHLVESHQVDDLHPQLSTFLALGFSGYSVNRPSIPTSLSLHHSLHHRYHQRRRSDSPRSSSNVSYSLRQSSCLSSSHSIIVFVASNSCWRSVYCGVRVCSQDRFINLRADSQQTRSRINSINIVHFGRRFRIHASLPEPEEDTSQPQSSHCFRFMVDFEGGRNCLHFRR